MMDLEAAIQHGLDSLHDGDALLIRRVDEIGHEIGILKRHAYERVVDSASSPDTTEEDQ